VVAAALAAAMSSVDSSINSVATVTTLDIYQRLLRPGRHDRHYLKIARLAASFTSLVMLGGALYLLDAPTKTLQDTATILASLLSGGLFGLFALGFFTRRGDARAAWSGIVTTALFTTWVVLAGRNALPAWLSSPFDLYYTAIIGNVIMFAVGWLTAFALGDRRRDLSGLTLWTRGSETGEKT
jgi:SSS family solute:Na+ symporter